MDIRAKQAGKFVASNVEAGGEVLNLSSKVWLSFDHCHAAVHWSTLISN